jgi:hypothetical protein
MKKIIALLAVSIAFLLSGQASAALIINGDFTADNWPANTAFPAQPTNLSSISGWTFLPGATIVGLGAGFAGIPTPSVDLSGWADAMCQGAASGKISAPLPATATRLVSPFTTSAQQSRGLISN